MGGNLALALLTGALLAALFPPFQLAGFAPVALVPLLWAVSREPRWTRRLTLGWASGFLYWFAICPWIQFVLEIHGEMGFWGGWGSYLLFCLLKSIHLAVFAALAGPVLRSRLALPGIPALWVALDRTHSTFGFQWLMIGNAGIDMAVPLRAAPFAGVYGVTFAFVLISAAVTLMLLRRPRIEYAGILILGLLFVLPEVPPPARPDRVAVAVQPNQPVNRSWTYEELAASYERMAVESYAAASNRQADLVVWPESPASFSYDTDERFRALTARLAATLRAPFLFGTVLERAGGEITNSAVMVDERGQPVGTYDKVNLVPFGEFVPAPFGFVNRITQEAGEFVPGTGPKLLPLRDAERTAVIICYESAFPHYVARSVALGGSVIVNLSNDGYFGQSAAPAQHLLLARMRAVETGRWLVRATNDGITASIDPAGRVLAALPEDTFAAGRLPFALQKRDTGYVRFGDWLPLLSAFVAASAFLAGCRASKTQKESNHVKVAPNSG